MPAADRPNIVFVLADNVGWGDWSCYGGSQPTPRIDKLAAEGTRFNNYCVENECTPTRTAIMTGRQSARTGTFTALPMHGGPTGLSEWEITIAQVLSEAGYATSHYGKWHLGEIDGRLPTDKGFDEWWGYRNSADEHGWTRYAALAEFREKFGSYTPCIWEAKKGGEQKVVCQMDMELRAVIDELIVEKATDYIKEHAKGDKPFFTYVCLSHIHPPEAVHPDFNQTDPSRIGWFSDLMAEQDYRVGQVVDAVEEAGISDNTLFVFSSDNGALNTSVGDNFGGSSGPFRGNFWTPPWEGSYRTGCMVRWPGKTPAGVVTEEMLTAHDWFKTFAALAGAADKVPTDRPMDGIDASQFLLGKSKTTGRESYLFFGPDGKFMSAKWNNYKLVHRYCNGMAEPILTPSCPLLFDLGSDPGELYNLLNTRMDMAFLNDALIPIAIEYALSVKQYPNVEPGAVDFKGYHGLEQDARDEEIKLAKKKIARAAKPPMGPPPETTAEAIGQKSGAEIIESKLGKSTI